MEDEGSRRRNVEERKNEATRYMMERDSIVLVLDTVQGGSVRSASKRRCWAPPSFLHIQDPSA